MQRHAGGGQSYVDQAQAPHLHVEAEAVIDNATQEALELDHSAKGALRKDEIMDFLASLIALAGTLPSGLRPFAFSNRI